MENELYVEMMNRFNVCLQDEVNYARLAIPNFKPTSDSMGVANFRAMLRLMAELQAEINKLKKPTLKPVA